MAKISGFLQRQEAQSNAIIRAMMTLTMQYAIDTLQITLHQTEGWGYERIMRLTEAWKRTRDEYWPAMDPKDPEADVMQEHMDRIMIQIINGRQELIPFQDRYTALKQVTYGGQKWR